MKNQRGFSLIELLIVVVIILIIAAIAIPSLLRARIAANESAMTGDIRTVISAQTEFYAANNNVGYCGTFGDLSTNTGNIPNAPAMGRPFLDPIVADTTITKGGYERLFEAGAVVMMTPDDHPNSVDGFYYGGSPTTVGRTGNRGFGGDSTGLICFTADGAEVPHGTPGELDIPCMALR